MRVCVSSDRLEIRAQRTTAVEVEIVTRPTRCSPASSRIPPRHPIAVGPALDPDPRACWDGAALSGLVRARDPTTYDGHRLHRICPPGWASLRPAWFFAASVPLPMNMGWPKPEEAAATPS